MKSEGLKNHMLQGLQSIDLSKVKLVMFDLDGTLYEDTAHFRLYADQLKQVLRSNF
jgi:ribonucleotide monophosphatase NagD (HAD superfamily)